MSGVFPGNRSMVARALADAPRCYLRRQKIRFATEDEAVSALMRAVRREGCPPLRTYRCPQCWGWHLTSQPKRSL